jgi:flagellar biosynthesis protein FlhF
MQGTRTLRGTDLPALLGSVRHSLGEDAVILQTRSPAETDGTHYEVTVAPAGWSAATHQQGATAARIAGPWRVALVGPPGAGKTTMAARLALHPAAYGGRAVGLLTLDTYRAGAVEQLFVYAEIAGLPLEVAYDAAGAEAALERLAGCDVVIIDTPGRGLRDPGQREWHEALTALRPHETHLVLPAWMRPELARVISEGHRGLGPDHLIVTMTDQVDEPAPQDAFVIATGLTARWWATGPGVPGDLMQAGVWTAASASALAWAS